MSQASPSQPRPASPYLSDKTSMVNDGNGQIVPQPAATPEGRVAASRMALQQALMADTSPTGKAVSVVDKIKRAALEVPFVQLVVDSAQSKWKGHPLQPVVAAAGQGSQMLAWPLARRFPVGLVLSAAGVGATLFLLKPWRLLLRPRIVFAAASFFATPLIRRGVVALIKRALSRPTRPQ